VASTRQRGVDWERTAERYLQRRGLRTLARNYQSRFGEIDLVMRDAAELVFVEVRYRHSERYGSGAESVTPAKQRRIASAAGLYLRQHPGADRLPCRFDVVSITEGAEGPRFDWIRQAFDAG